MDTYSWYYLYSLKIEHVLHVWSLGICCCNNRWRVTCSVFSSIYLHLKLHKNIFLHKNQEKFHCFVKVFSFKWVFISQQFPLSGKVQCFNPINFPLASGFWLLPHERRHVGSPSVILMRCWAPCTMKGQSKEPSQACMGAVWMHCWGSGIPWKYQIRAFHGLPPRGALISCFVACWIGCQRLARGPQ